MVLLETLASQPLVINYDDYHQIIKSFKPSKQVDVLTIQLKSCFMGIKR
jgi:hypothetical protein